MPSARSIWLSNPQAISYGWCSTVWLGPRDHWTQVKSQVHHSRCWIHQRYRARAGRSRSFRYRSAARSMRLSRSKPLIHHRKLEFLRLLNWQNTLPRNGCWSCKLLTSLGPLVRNLGTILLSQTHFQTCTRSFCLSWLLWYPFTLTLSSKHRFFHRASSNTWRHLRKMVKLRQVTLVRFRVFKRPHFRNYTRWRSHRTLEWKSKSRCSCGKSHTAQSPSKAFG